MKTLLLAIVVFLLATFPRDLADDAVPRQHPARTPPYWGTLPLGDTRLGAARRSSHPGWRLNDW